MTLAHAAAGAAIGSAHPLAHERPCWRASARTACMDLPGHDDLDEAERGRADPRHDRPDRAPVRHAQPRVLVRLRLLDARPRARRAARQARCASIPRTASRGSTTRCPGPRATAPRAGRRRARRARPDGPLGRPRAGARVSETPGNLAGPAADRRAAPRRPELPAQRRARARARRRGRARASCSTGPTEVPAVRGRRGARVARRRRATCCTTAGRCSATASSCWPTSPSPRSPSASSSAASACSAT